jgi:CP family cyanate transporter-like MFS transporter
LLWLAGISLRVTVLAIPPLIPEIHHSLRLSETAVGALSALPILLLAAAAIPGSLLIARVGARRALILGLTMLAVAGALRGVGTSVLVICAMTFVMGMGIAISQPALPSLVRQWFAHWSGPATAIYSNGYLIGELAPAALTASVLLPAMGGAWALALASWSIVPAATAVAILLAAPHESRAPTEAAVRWWPDWRNPVTWRLGLILGCASVSYWGANAFIPDYLRVSHHTQLITPALTALNVSQLPASVLVLLLPGVLIGRRWPFLLAGLLTVVVTLGLRQGGGWVIALGGVIGFASAVVFVLVLALPPILAGERDVHHVSAAIFTISYTCPFLGSFLGGALWDLSGVSIAAFTPLVAAGLTMALLAGGLRLPGDTSLPASEALHPTP